MSRHVRLAVVMALFAMSLCVGAEENKPKGEADGSRQVIALLRAGGSLGAASELLKQNFEPETIDEILGAAKEGGMNGEDRRSLISLMLDLVVKEKKRISGLVDQFMDACAKDNKAEYESAMQQVLSEEKKIVPELRRRLEDENALKRMGVLDALGRLGDKDRLVVRDARLMLDDRDVGVRQMAVETLVKIAPPEIVDELIDVLERRTLDCADGVATALGKLGHEKAVKPLTKRLLNSREPMERRAIALALGELRTKDADAVNALLDAVLDDQDGLLRVRAAEALGKIGAGKAEGYIIRGFQRYNSKPGCDELLRQLKYFKSLAAFDFLTSCLDADSPDTRRAAQETLQILTGSEANGRAAWEEVRKDLGSRPDWVPQY